jgi:hypothetical protein
MHFRLTSGIQLRTQTVSSEETAQTIPRWWVADNTTYVHTEQRML